MSGGRTGARDRPSTRRLDLEPLSKWDSRRLVAEILQKVDQVPETLRDLVVAGAEGNPFFIEELIKMLIEDGVIVKGEEQWRLEPDRGWPRSGCRRR